LELLIAKSAGFCFGVNKAVDTVYNLLNDKTNKIYTLGPIIHNEVVVNDFAKNGVTVIDKVEEAEEGSTVVIRTHGVAPWYYEKLKQRNINIVDATCPYVKKIQKLVKEKYNEGYRILIAGDASHPEIIGINGWCDNSAVIVNDPGDIEKMDMADESLKYCIVAQTTLTREKWDRITEKLKEKCKNFIKFDTICNATADRQAEVEEIAKNADAMIVIGSKKSSNTQKLVEISKKYCKNTFSIEKFGDLPPIDISKIKVMGITAGASTPNRIIKEVIEKMDELNKQNPELSFSEEFEKSLVTLRNGDIVKGKIIGYNNSEIFVDLGYKSDGIIPVSEYTDDPDFTPEGNLNIGDEIEVFIIRVNDGDGNVLLSKKKVDSIRGLEEIEKAFENKTPVTAKVIEVTNGGLIASKNGVRIFIPASQVSDSYVRNLADYLKQTVTVRIMEFNKQKRKIVGSQRVILMEEKQRAENEFWQSVEIGKEYSGTVKSVADFGVFVDIGGVDGLVHVSELSWTKIKYPSEVLKPGDKVDVTVIGFDREKKRISLSYRKPEDNPWVKVATKYAVGDIIKGKVVRLVPFGAFIEIDEGIDGLCHISQISNFRISKPGDVLEVGREVEAKIIEFNPEIKKISLSIKEVNPIDPVRPSKEAEKAAPDTADDKEQKPAPTEHIEEMTNTIGDVIKLNNLSENN